MFNYRVSFSIDGKQTETNVSAWTTQDAEKLVKAQYPMSKILIYWVKRA